MEDKQLICDLLFEALQATRELSDLEGLTYRYISAGNEIVEAVFPGGYVKVANVSLDSGIAMIRDILRQIG